MSNCPDIDQKQRKKSFYPYAEVIKTMRPFDPGTNKYRHKAAILVGSSGKLVKVRRYKGPGDERRVTIEIEV
ncbi:MAG TPA: hypothetical protein DHV36_12450 [Desulfobacteraceae bacterium]|nr:hypothetical protein [Desulfobacteraceae bacterium]